MRKKAAQKIKVEAATRIVQELCKHSCFLLESGLAQSVILELAYSMSQHGLTQLMNMVVLGRREDERQRKEVSGDGMEKEDG